MSEVSKPRESMWASTWAAGATQAQPRAQPQVWARVRARAVSVSVMALAVGLSMGLPWGLRSACSAAEQPAPAPFAKPAPEDPALDELLARSRWMEESTGMSLRPPLQTRIAQQAGDKSTVIISPSYQVRVYIKRSKEAMALRDLHASMINQVGLAQPAASILGDEAFAAEGRQGFSLYFQVPGAKKTDSPWVLGQSIYQIDPQTVALLRLETDVKQFPSVRPVFEKMLSTLRVTDPRAIVARRKELTRHAEAWHKGVDTAKRHAALIPSQLFRVMQDGRDVGWMTMNEAMIDAKKARALRDTPGEAVDKPGVYVQVQARVIHAERIIDTQSEFYVSDDGAEETWRLRTTIRPANEKSVPLPRPLQNEGLANPKGKPAVKPGPKPTTTKKPQFDSVDDVRNQIASRNSEREPLPNEYDAVEIGIRHANEIVITRETPTGVQNATWTVPTGDQGHYVSQVDVMLLGRLLPQTATEMGFYAYYPTEGRLTFRTESVTPQAGGGATVRSQPVPDQEEQVTVYDRAGRMVRRNLPSGQEIIPATEAQLRSIWAQSLTDKPRKP